MEANYYKILEITETASEEVIRAAYRALAKKYHPDSYKGSNADRNKYMAQINEAYEVLSNEQKRKSYDLKLQLEKEDQQRFTGDSKKNTKNRTYETYEDTYEERPDKEIYKTVNEDDDYSEIEKDITPSGGVFFKIIHGIGKEIVRTMQDNNREIENAYLEGLSFDDFMLVRRFKTSTSYKRLGYARALEEKGLLKRSQDGKLVPTYRFKELF